MLAKTGALPEELGKAETMLADSGYFSEANVKACIAAGIEPLLAMGRESHHPSLSERYAEAPATPENPTPVEAMAHRLQTPEGKKLYAQRKCIPEPVFGIIKSVLGFRQFFAARAGQSQRRVEPRDHGLELEADVGPEGRLRGLRSPSRESKLAERRLRRNMQHGDACRKTPVR